MRAPVVLFALGVGALVGADAIVWDRPLGRIIYTVGGANAWAWWLGFMYSRVGKLRSKNYLLAKAGLPRVASRQLPQWVIGIFAGGGVAGGSFGHSLKATSFGDLVIATMLVGAAGVCAWLLAFASFSFVHRDDEISRWYREHPEALAGKPAASRRPTVGFSVARSNQALGVKFGDHPGRADHEDAKQ